MTVIYADTLFLINALVDYLLLLAGARLAGEPLHRLRFGAGAVLGGLYAVAIFLPGMGFLDRLPCRGAAAVLMLVTAYGGSRRLLRQCIIFFALACAFGGSILAISLMGREGLSLGRGVIYSSMDIKIVLLSAAVCYGVLTLVFQRAGKHTSLTGELLPVQLRLGARSVELTALVDTGNTLTDPITGKPVMVAEGERLMDLFPKAVRPSAADLMDPAEVLTRLCTGEWQRRFRLLPYRAVGVDRGLLLAVRVDSLTMSGREFGAALVALSPTPVSDGGSYRALIGPINGKDGIR